MLTHSAGRASLPFSLLDTPARDKPSLRAKTTTIRIRIHRSKRTYSFTFFPNMADMVTQRAFGPRVMCVTVAAVVRDRSRTIVTTDREIPKYACERLRVLR